MVHCGTGYHPLITRGAREHVTARRSVREAFDEERQRPHAATSLLTRSKFSAGSSATSDGGFMSASSAASMRLDGRACCQTAPVAPEEFHAAVHVLGRDGYRGAGHAPWIRDLPLFEVSLRHEDGWRPPIDLHWRLHCGETAFSREYLLQSHVDGRGIRAPRPVDELAALLLFWSRDGLAGLRHAVDVAAWWDRHGGDLPPRALDTLIGEHPQLRGAFTAAVLLADRTVGVPADNLLGDADRHGLRTRLALRIAKLAEQSSAVQFEASAIAVDGLLQPRGEGAAFLRRHFLPPSPVITHLYGLPPRSRRASLELRRLHYAASRCRRLSPAAIALARAVSR